MVTCHFAISHFAVSHFARRQCNPNPNPDINNIWNGMLFLTLTLTLILGNGKRWSGKWRNGKRRSGKTRSQFPNVYFVGTTLTESNKICHTKFCENVEILWNGQFPWLRVSQKTVVPSDKQTTSALTESRKQICRRHLPFQNTKHRLFHQATLQAWDTLSWQLSTEPSQWCPPDSENVSHSDSPYMKLYLHESSNCHKIQTYSITNTQQTDV